MARRRIMNYGPTARSMETVSETRLFSKGGVITRMPPGLAQQKVVKSRLTRRVMKGISLPGHQPLNYLTPTD